MSSSRQRGASGGGADAGADADADGDPDAATRVARERGGTRRTPRFHHDEALIVGTEIALGKERSRHLSGVLRSRAGDIVCLFDGDGHDYRAELLEPGRAARLRILSRTLNPTESPLAVTLVQGVSRGDRMDATVRQAVELGVARIVPVLTSRGQVSLDEARAAKRHAHWRGIVISACEQCGRSRVPDLDPPRSFGEWLSSVEGATADGVVLVPGAPLSLGEARFPDSTATLVVGPESGLDGGETQSAVAAGLQAVRFGLRVLRTETAGPAAIAVLQARHGDLAS